MLASSTSPMATLSVISHSSLFLLSSKVKGCRSKYNSVNHVIIPLVTSNPLDQKSHLSFSLHSKHTCLVKPIKSSLKDGQESEESISSTTVAIAPENPSDETPSSELSSEEDGPGHDKDSGEMQKQQEMDWKTDEEFKKFMGNPSIEAAIKLEKKRADRKLKELDRERSDNPIVGLFNRLVRDSLTREKERLEKAEEAFRALDLNKVMISIIN